MQKRDPRLSTSRQLKAYKHKRGKVDTIHDLLFEMAGHALSGTSITATYSADEYYTALNLFRDANWTVTTEGTTITAVPPSRVPPDTFLEEVEALADELPMSPEEEEDWLKRVYFFSLPRTIPIDRRRIMSAVYNKDRNRNRKKTGASGASDNPTRPINP